MKTCKKFLSFALAAILIMTVLAACGTTEYTVEFDSQGGSTVASAKVGENDLVTKPDDPTREGYNFGGWYKEAACVNAWDFAADKATADITVYAKWMSQDYKQWVMDTFNVLDNYNPEGLNTYTATFEEMVAYLKEQGVIAGDAEAVDMQTTDGYLYNNGTGTYEGKASFADKAYAYGDVMLVWWDMDHNSEFVDCYNNLGYNNNAILVGGGQYTMPMTSVSGYFAINFKPILEVQNQWNIDNEEAWREKVNAKTGEYADMLAVFNGIDSHRTRLSQYKSINDIAAELRREGIIEAADIAQAKNLNEEYQFTASYYPWDSNELTEGQLPVSLATEAMTYGKVTVYYFNTNDPQWNKSTLKPMFENIGKDKKTEVYYGVYNELDTRNPEKSLYKCDGNKMYSEEGTQLTYSVDFVIGSFAVAIAE